jgi:hypothetical protein
MGRIARLSVARSAEKGTFSPVVQAHGTMKWSLSGVSRQSLEGEFCELPRKPISGSWVDAFPLIEILGSRTSRQYYEEAREVSIIPEGSRSWFGTVIGVGPGLTHHNRQK